jgi:hypothetical protein
MDHPWIKTYNWKDLGDKKIESPFIPKVGDNFDRKYCEAIDKIGVDTKDRYENYIRLEDFHIKFRNFTYCTTFIDSTPKRKLYDPKTSRTQLNSSTYSNKSGLVNTNNIKSHVSSILPKPKLNGYSQSSYNILYNNMVANLKKSKERERSHNNITNGKTLFERDGSALTNRSSSIVIKSPTIPPTRLDSAKIKKLINSTSTNNIFKNFKSPVPTTTVGKKSLTNSLIYLNNKSSNKVSSKSSFNY